MALHDSPNLLEFFHQVEFCVKSTGGVDNQNIVVPIVCGFHRIEHYRTRIGSLLMRDHWAVQPLAPDFELVDCRSAECIAGSKHDLPAEALVRSGKLCDGCRFTDTIDAHDHHDKWRSPLQDLDFTISRGEFKEFDHLDAKNFPRFGRVADPVAIHPITQVSDQLLTDVPTDVCL